MATLALLASLLVEISQLYKAPWIESIRRTTLAGLMLGFDFVWSDPGCSAVEVGLGTLLVESGPHSCGGSASIADHGARRPGLTGASLPI